MTRFRPARKKDLLTPSHPVSFARGEGGAENRSPTASGCPPMAEIPVATGAAAPEFLFKAVDRPSDWRSEA